MQVLGVPTAMAAALVVVATLSGVSQPAEAGKVCNELDLASPCIRDSDLRPSLRLGGGGDDGRLRLRNGDGDTAVELRASSGNVTNLFFNDENESNGLVKAWAAINADGTVAACWRCNLDPAETRKFGTGVYRVDFTPLSPDIRGRPRSATVSAPSGPPLAAIRVAETTGEFSALNVATNNPTTGAFLNAPFVLIVY